LAWQRDRIPRHAMGTCHGSIDYFYQHMMQAMTKLIKQDDELIIGQQSRAIADGWSKVTDQITNRCWQAVTDLHTGTQTAHPADATLTLAGIQVKIEAANDLTLIFQFKITCIRMPYRGFTFNDLNAIQTIDNIEEALQDFRCWEVRF